MLHTTGPACVGFPEKVPYSEIYDDSGAATGQVLQPHPVLLSVWVRTYRFFITSSVDSEDNPSEGWGHPHSFCESGKLRNQSNL